MPAVSIWFAVSLTLACRSSPPSYPGSRPSICAARRPRSSPARIRSAPTTEPMPSRTTARISGSGSRPRSRLRRPGLQWADRADHAGPRGGAAFDDGRCRPGIEEESDAPASGIASTGSLVATQRLRNRTQYAIARGTLSRTRPPPPYIVQRLVGDESPLRRPRTAPAANAAALGMGG